ncbi:hypothetical protein Y032_0685g1525 [Ancylostoma ceylanicum]|nr:hypothetical protein Y032_0685g1525 [Ancylostoma ceylanicum]
MTTVLGEGIDFLIFLHFRSGTGEKSLRKRFVCVKTEPRDSVVDAVGEVIILNKQKKTPREFTLAGEVDGAAICFRVVVVPPSFGLKHSKRLFSCVYLYVKSNIMVGKTDPSLTTLPSFYSNIRHMLFKLLHECAVSQEGAAEPSIMDRKVTP